MFFALPLITIFLLATVTCQESDCLGGGACDRDSQCTVQVGEAGASSTSASGVSLSEPVMLTGECQKEGAASGTCTCFAGFAGEFCTRRAKSQSTAFVLSLIMGAYGADRFYLAANVLGIVKLVLTIIMCYVPCVPLVKRCTSKPEDDVKFSALASCSLFCVAYLAVAAWWIVDWVFILTGQMNDGFGCPLTQDL